MHQSPAAVFTPAGIRHHELQDDAAPLGLARELFSDDPTRNPAISTAYRHSGAALVRTVQQLKSIRWKILLTSRGAVPR